ncbi:hypothetical protein ENSA5_24020 [Enhygromyxa salina]|uniref:Uncharacterized protein n=1 Tax=Enhygromyxa salina TaxID=215803 RepID=A0A2S9YB53_9BACT|nr:hypothetical protein ENSA5_24020 [Enhygromyxa salina]
MVLGPVGGGCSSFEAPGGFEDDLDDGDPPPPDLLQPECDPRRLDECEAGQKCSHLVDPDLGPINRCVELSGEGVEGEACERVGDTDTCAKHHICWATDAEGIGTCVAFCTSTLVCEDPLAICSVSTGGLLSLCLPKCDPLIQDCAEGFGCYPDDYERWSCDRDQSGAAGAHGDACACLNCCDPGLMCMSGALVDAEGCGLDGAPGCCGAICTLDEAAAVEGQCPSEAERCEPFYESDAVLMGYEQVGLCQL